MSQQGFRVFSLIVPIAAALAGLTGCAPEAVGVEEAREGDGAAGEFAALQERGQQAMGVDQYTSTHLFDALADGGRIELQRDLDDPEGVAQIRRHLREIVEAFQAGDFSTPEFVHMQEVPGASIMAASQGAITYSYRELPRGGEVRIVTRDSEALEAIHAFLAFQRQDHRAGGLGHQEHAGGMTHDAEHQEHAAGMTHDAAHQEHAEGMMRHEHMQHPEHLEHMQHMQHMQRSHPDGGHGDGASHHPGRGGDGPHPHGIDPVRPGAGDGPPLE